MFDTRFVIKQLKDVCCEIVFGAIVVVYLVYFNARICNKLVSSLKTKGMSSVCSVTVFSEFVLV